MQPKNADKICQICQTPSRDVARRKLGQELVEVNLFTTGEAGGPHDIRRCCHFRRFRRWVATSQRRRSN
jgi:hypothetical protein